MSRSAAETIAYEHCLWAKERGLKPCDVLASIGSAHGLSTTWPNAVRGVAMAWQRMQNTEAAA